MKRKKAQFDRSAITHLKALYQNGTVFADAVAIRDAIIGQFGSNPAKITCGKAAYWDRQARYELAAIKIFVTPPVPRYRRERTPNAAPKRRIETMHDRYAEHVTRHKNLLLMTEAAAAQPDARADEIRAAEGMRIGLSIITGVADQVKVAS